MRLSQELLRLYRGGDLMEINEATYVGAKPLRALNVIKRILKTIRNFTGSQCKLKSRGVIWQYLLCWQTWQQHSVFFEACLNDSQEYHTKYTVTIVNPS